MNILKQDSYLVNKLIEYFERGQYHKAKILYEYCIMAGIKVDKDYPQIIEKLFGDNKL